MTSFRTYRVGTLSYTPRKLRSVVSWLLLGDFCFTLMEAVVPAILPLMLANLGAPNWVTALVLTAIPGVLNATVCPVVSFCSDRHRGSLGRRIPFILYTIPFLCFFLAMIGLAPHLARLLSGEDHKTVALVLIGLFASGFQFFNMFVASVYYYLFNDVVPQEFIGRFLSFFRIVSVLATSVFYLFIFPHANTHFAAIFVGAGLIYGAACTLMCLKVKEGEYPPVASSGSGGVLTGVKTFVTECFTSSFYWVFYLAISLWAAAAVGNVFLVLMAKNVGLTIEQFGLYTGAAAIISAVLFLPAGVLCDRFHPLKTLVTAASGQAVIALMPLAFLFLGASKNSFIVWCIAFGASLPFLALYTSSELPTFMRLLPGDRFGQFCSAIAMVRSVTTVITGMLCGFLLDLLRRHLANPDDVYRYLPFWTASFQGLSALCLWFLFFKWKRRTAADALSTESQKEERLVSPAAAF